MQAFARTVYGIFGTLAVAAGLAAVAQPSLILPPEESTGVAGHLIREQGALFVFIGLMLFWCLKHMEQRRPVILALIAAFAIYSGIHWQGYFESGERILGAIATAVPVLLLLITLPRR
jgi:hypothetical protein